MTPVETLTWLQERLKEIDTKIDSWSLQNCKGGIEIEVQRQVSDKEDIHSVLQPPMLQGKIEDLLSEVTQRKVEFSVKYYPEPTPDGKSRGPKFRPEWMSDEWWEEAKNDTLKKEGGWGGGYSGQDKRRTLYRLKVQMPIEPIQCPDKWLRLEIKDALYHNSWTMSVTKVQGRTASRFFEVGEQVTRKEKPNPNELLYFVTSYAIPGSGGAGVLKVLDLAKKKFRFICIPSPMRAGAFL